MSEDKREKEIVSILPLGDSRLQTPCRAVDDVSAAEAVLETLHATLSWAQSQYDFQRGSGIAAPQIGELVQVSVVEFDGLRRELVNPEIVAHSEEKMLVSEGCLSFFQFRGEVERYHWVEIRALDGKGATHQFRAEGDFASLVQHELDHLQGILIVDRISNGKEGLLRKEGSPELCS